MEESLDLGTSIYHHRAYLNDPISGLKLDEASAVHILELPNVPTLGEVETDLHRWLRFFKEAPTFSDGRLPPYMQTQEMKQAMATIRAFTEEERQRHLYNRRQLYERIQLGHQMEREELDRDLADTRASLKEAQERGAATERALASIQTRAATLEARNADLKAQNQSLQTQVERAMSLVESMEKRLQTLEARDQG